ncbi:hypothetical protein GYA54_04630, partial [Candidatus Kuenenbacteria bacterium]|nr:hypothetical protein [Candidatus Kuenenbacteria bacterium]
EWFEKFGIRDTRDWRQLLEIDPAKAKEALQHVVDNREHFPQYDDNWVKDREKELDK